MTKLALLAGLVALVVPAAASAAVPKLADLKSSSELEVRPHQIVLSVDGSVVLGLKPRCHHCGGYLTWQFWTTKQAEQEGYGWQPGAYAYGTLWTDNCTPNCAAGTFYASDAGLEAWRIRHGLYTRMALQSTRGNQEWCTLYSLRSQWIASYGWSYNWNPYSNKQDPSGFCGP